MCEGHVAHLRLDDRAVHAKRCGLCKRHARRRIPGQQASDDLHHLALVFARSLGRAFHAAAHLGHRVDEGAAAKRRVGEPFGHHVGEQQQGIGITGAFVRAAASQCIDEPGHPSCMPVIEKGAHQVVLRREVPVEGDLGDARGGNDAVDAGGADAVGIEEVVRREQDALARGQCGDVHGAIVGM
jgi:hypothetical protein